jgi:SAM-dependent methyltransferase
MTAVGGPDTDAFGRALLDWVEGGTEPEVHEREDGWIEVGAGPELYLAAYEQWPVTERRAMRLVRGRAVDVGCGAGRVALHLQEEGVDVVATDASPLAVRAARRRGVRRVHCLSAEELDGQLQRFDTVLLMGNNTGIFGTPSRLRTCLSIWSLRLGPEARILAESASPSGGGVPTLDPAYRRANRRRGRMPGQLRLRTRYHGAATPWFWWLYVSPAELRGVVKGTGWRVATVLSSTADEPFVALLVKDDQGAGRRGGRSIR